MLRRRQYRIADILEESCLIARTMIFGKLHNARWSIERTRRNHGLHQKTEKLSAASMELKQLLPAVLETTNLDRLRGLEGVGPPPILGYWMR